MSSLGSKMSEGFATVGGNSSCRALGSTEPPAAIQGAVFAVGISVWLPAGWPILYGQTVAGSTKIPRSNFLPLEQFLFELPQQTPES